ncbi:MAG: KpsF/GutQ family sugar-phosphate isomerase [Phycisphaerales bacterium]|nr:KpsF/GutQ family sugar-phosphate isomerase [Phycisphaerales bacterium]
MSEPLPATDRTGEIEFLVDVLHAESDAVRRIAERVTGVDRERWAAAIDLVAGSTGHLVVSGMGKSGLIGAKISATFSSLGQPSSTLHPAEAVHGDLGRVRRGDLVMLLSYSGETEEVVSLAAILKADGVPRIGISSNPKSRLAGLSTIHLCTGDIIEACPLNLAPTASTTATLAVGDALALAVARRRDFDATDFQKHHPGGMLGVGLRPVTEVLRFRVGVNLAVIDDACTVREALVRARPQPGTRRSGAILLVDDSGRLSGIFTDSDFRRLILDEEQAGMSRPIAEVMTHSPRHLTTDNLVRDAVALVTEYRLDEIPVLDAGGRPVGLIDVQDLIAMKVVRED